jgi:hypothetical protein
MRFAFNDNRKKYAAVFLGILFSAGIFVLTASAQDPVIQFNPHGARYDGSVDSVEIESSAITAQRVRISGWAFSQLDSDGKATVRIAEDVAGLLVVEQIETTITRNDVKAAFPNSSLTSGFHWRAPARFYDGAEHSLYFFAGDDELNSWQYIGEAIIPVVDSGVVGSIDGVIDNHVIGWAMDLDDLFLDTSQIPVAVYVDGDFVAAGVANLARSDVESHYENDVSQVGPRHGYNVELSPEHLRLYRDDQLHGIEVFALEVTEGDVTSLGTIWKKISHAGIVY